MSCPPSSPPPAARLSQPLPTAQDSTDQATLIEVFTEHATDGGATGFVLGHARATPQKPLLWVQDRVTLREAGRPYAPAIPGGWNMIHVTVNKAVDALWTMEEALRCADLCGVIGEIWGDPPALDFTATKRLALRAEANRVPAWLIRRAAQPNLSAARERWRIKSLPSLMHPYDSHAPGYPQWQATLFRARWRTPGDWVVQYEPGQGLHFLHPTAVSQTPAQAAQA